MQTELLSFLNAVCNDRHLACSICTDVVIDHLARFGLGCDTDVPYNYIEHVSRVNPEMASFPIRTELEIVAEAHLILLEASMEDKRSNSIIFIGRHDHEIYTQSII